VGRSLYRFTGRQSIIASMLKRILLTLATLLPLAAQQTPPTGPIDCLMSFYFVSGNGTAQIDNRVTGCDQWTIVYQADQAISGYTLAFQYTTGINVPGAFIAYPATNVQNKSTSFGTASSGLATYCNLATCGSSFVTINTPWVRVSVAGATGVGGVRGTLYGYRTGYTGGGGGNGGGGGGTGCPSPCPVEGVDAAGAAPTVPPVAVSGFDGTDGQRIKTDTSGDILNIELGTGTFNGGQQAVTGSAANLGSNASKEVCVTANVENTANVFVGNSSVASSGGSIGFELAPGLGVCSKVSNTNLVYVIAVTTGQTISYTYRN